MRVYVLMSTYNGERYVVEQLKSILAQLPAEGRVMVRDDGSTDATVSRITDLGDSRIEISCGENIGFARSFLTLVQNTPSHADMVMFADQDDVWLPSKIERAWQRLLPHSRTPALYCSAQLLVDQALTPLQRTPPWPRPPSFAGALAENVVTGCTAAFNARGAELLKQSGVPSQVCFHDWWAYLVISALGEVVFDPEPTLLYRQHGANQIGRGAGWWGRQKQMLRFLLHNDWVGILLGQVAELRRHYSERLSGEQRNLIDRHFAFNARGDASPRWALILSARRWRQSLRDEAPFRVLLLRKYLILSLRSRR